MRQRQRSSKKKVQLNLEQLEDRWVPALSSSFNGTTLFLGDGTAANGTPAAGLLTITINADGTVDAGDNGLLNNKANDVPASSISIRLGNVGSSTLIDAAAGSFGGSITYTAGNGVDSVSVTGANSIGGNLNITTGTNADVVEITDTDIAGSLTINTNNGADTVTTTGAVVIAGSANFRGVNTLTTSAGTIINGNLSFDSSSDPLPDNVSVDGSILGLATITTSLAGADTITLAATGSVGSSLFINSGNGLNVISTAAGSLIGNNLVITTGSGADSIALLGDIGNNLTIVTGNGNDSVAIGGNISGTQITVITGTGNDSIEFSAAAGGARLTALMGEGDDTFRYAAGAVLASDYLNGDFGTNLLFLDVAVTWPFTHLNFS